MKKSGILSGTLALLIITLLAGLLLSAVHELTREPIAEADREAKKAAYNEVLAGAAYTEPENGGDRVAAFNEALAAGTYNETYDGKTVSYQRASIEEALLVQDEAGQTVGFVLTVVSKSGYNGEIRLALGIGTDGAIGGMKVLAHSETAGFGANCEKPEYRETFVGDTAVKDVDALTGATYTTNAIKEAVGAALCYVRTEFTKEVSAA